MGPLQGSDASVFSHVRSGYGCATTTSSRHVTRECNDGERGVASDWEGSDADGSDAASAGRYTGRGATSDSGNLAGDASSSARAMTSTGSDADRMQTILRKECNDGWEDD